MELFRSPIFSSHIEGLMQAQHVPGLAMAILDNNTVASVGFGMASLDPPKPCTPDTLFNIASASKSLTAASVALLVHDNDHYPEVQYEATMSSLLPDDFVMSQDEYTRGVTVDDVLGHRTGLASHDFSYLGVNAARPDDARSITRNLRNLAIAYPIRAKHLYCNMMYTVASYLVETMTRLTFAEFLDLSFFRPLNMNSTNLQPGRARAKGLGGRIATGYLWDDKNRRYQGIRTPDDPEAQGADAIVTSVTDYIKWIKALVNHEGPITKDVYQGIVRPRIIEEPDKTDRPPFTSPSLYSAGFETYHYRGYEVISHDGSNPGFRTLHFFVPKTKSGGVIFTNSDLGNDIVNILMREMTDEFLQVPKAERVDWTKVETAAARAGNEQDEMTTADSLAESCPGSDKPQPQSLPLDAYVGDYWNKGYRGLTIQVKNDELFIDATDRSFAFTLSLKHLCNQTHFRGRMRLKPPGAHGVGDENDIDVEFLTRNSTVVSMGLELDQDLPGPIWFDKV